jgi:hypothetical protein
MHTIDPVQLDLRQSYVRTLAWFQVNMAVCDSIVVLARALRVGASYKAMGDMSRMLTLSLK